MEKTQQFISKKLTAIYAIGKATTYIIIALLLLIMSLSAFCQITLKEKETKTDALKYSTNASEETPQIHMTNLTYELNSNYSDIT